MNWIFKEIRESVRLYFLPVTNPEELIMSHIITPEEALLTGAACGFILGFALASLMWFPRKP